MKFLFEFFFFNNAFTKINIKLNYIPTNSIEYLKSNCFIIEFSFNYIFNFILFNIYKTISYMKG